MKVRKEKAKVILTPEGLYVSPEGVVLGTLYVTGNFASARYPAHSPSAPNGGSPLAPHWGMAGDTWYLKRPKWRRRDMRARVREYILTHPWKSTYAIAKELKCSTNLVHYHRRQLGPQGRLYSFAGGRGPSGTVELLVNDRLELAVVRFRKKAVYVGHLSQAYKVYRFFVSLAWTPA